ncbi:MAG: hypothetical protein EA385_03870 [Salinarimonadaceae bacterium]|nr:MAG: hypothetical protein EA385_03870 [Salinarimonadaceae bacterium]
MKRRLYIVLFALVLLGGFSAYLVTMLQEHGAECDSTMRHCAVPNEEIAFMEGEWCAEIDPTALRERFAFEGDRIMTIQEGPLAVPGQDWRPVQFFVSMGELIYFEYSVDGAQRVSGEYTIRPDGPDRRVTSQGQREIAWIRCSQG